MDTLAHRLYSLGPTIVEICRISGTPGVSLGVLHENEVIHVDNFGYRDVEGKKAPDQDTLYFVASLSKLFTAAGIGILVDEQKLEWNTPVSSILPEFDHPDDTIKTKAGIVDFLSHRSGLAGKTQMWYSEFGRPALPRRDTMRFCSYLDLVYAFQQRWLYNNWGYGLADEVTEKVSGKSWGAFLRERIFDPLGMKGDGKLAEGAAGVQSNVRDLLTFYKSVMQADKEQRCSEDTSSPLKNIPTIMSPHITLEPDTASLERSYALGLIRTTLPGSLGVVGLNPMYVDKMPIVGKGMETPRLCIYHQGSIVPYLSSAHLLPDTNTAIVVLTNSMANNDAADWLGQLLLETVLDNPDKIDYVAIAKESAATSVALWPKMAQELEKRREPDTPQQPPITYVGIYYNIIGDWCIDVFEDEGILKMCFQEQRDESYRLTHHRYDEFSWLLTRDEDVRRGRFPVVNLEFYILTFRAAGDEDEMQQLIWRHDPDVPAGETFYRHPPK
ncbi:MAG: hypothetical protein Q9182_000099 [Xanthomendoza sp. 2 TL-2023]